MNEPKPSWFKGWVRVWIITISSRGTFGLKFVFAFPQKGVSLSEKGFDSLNLRMSLN
jgi:hypothetical protein